MEPEDDLPASDNLIRNLPLRASNREKFDFPVDETETIM